MIVHETTYVSGGAIVRRLVSAGIRAELRPAEAGAGPIGAWRAARKDDGGAAWIVVPESAADLARGLIRRSSIEDPKP